MGDSLGRDMKEPVRVLEILHIYLSGVHTNAYVCKNSSTIYYICMLHLNKNF